MKNKVLNLLHNQNSTLRILYVEDDAQTLTNTLSILKNFFINIDTATNGKEGLKLCNTYYYDIILTDLDMPEIDGLKMIEYIRQTNKESKIIIFSSYSEKEYFLESIHLGIDGYILKPFQLEQFVSVLSRILDENTLHIAKTNQIVRYIYLVDNFIWDKDTKKLLKNNKTIKLTLTEIKIFDFLSQRNNYFASKEDIYNYLYSNGSYISNEQKFRNSLSKLKTKINTKIVESYYSQGYILLTI